MDLCTVNYGTGPIGPVFCTVILGGPCPVGMPRGSIVIIWLDSRLRGNDESFVIASGAWGSKSNFLFSNSSRLRDYFYLDYFGRASQ